MILFLADLHLGRGTEAQSRSAERDAIALLESMRPRLLEQDGRLVLLGDVFNAYMEFPSMVPAGFVRFKGALAALSDAGVQITYVAGNRDHWQFGHLAREVGVHLVRDSTHFDALDRRVFVAHGDGFAPAERFSNRVRPLFRSRLAYWLFRNLLPADGAYRLARHLASRGSGEPEAEVAEGLRSAAERILADNQVDLVVLGHSHHAELHTTAFGKYLNVGYWFADRSFAVLDASGPHLLRWADGSWTSAETVPAEAPQHPHTARRSRLET